MRSLKTEKAFRRTSLESQALRTCKEEEEEEEKSKKSYELTNRNRCGLSKK
jgi:hypothetical protein